MLREEERMGQILLLKNIFMKNGKEKSDCEKEKRVFFFLIVLFFFKKKKKDQQQQQQEKDAASWGS